MTCIEALQAAKDRPGKIGVRPTIRPRELVVACKAGDFWDWRWNENFTPMDILDEWEVVEIKP